LDFQRRLADLLLFPQESLEHEIKNWLDFENDDDLANVIKAVIAYNYLAKGVLVMKQKKNSMF